ncbi:MAG: TlpA family protein disulfide reductase [Deltaproteobacteria bacterium]|nr:TlpA family protein disulfide reductase [Deltaproteobacteria bacterium]
MSGKDVREDKQDGTSEEGITLEGGLPRIAIGFIIAAIVVVVAVIVLSGRKAFEPVTAGAEAVGFTLPDLNGRPVSLKDYRGKVVFLNIWATWCATCEEEMPSMEALSKGLKGQPFEIIAVSIDSEGGETVKKFIGRLGLTFTVLHDRSGKIKDVYKTTGVPETFIIDQNGIIAEKVMGPRDWTNKVYLNTIMELLKNGPKSKDAYAAKKAA